MSFGYQQFFPDLHALKWDLRDQQWRVSAAASASAWDRWSTTAQQAWTALPGGAAFCAALPVQWGQAHPVFSSLPGGTEVMNQLEDGAGICWYAQSGLYAPVLTLRLKDSAGSQQDAHLESLFQAALRPPKKKADEGGDDNMPKVIRRKVAQGVVWSSDIPNSMGYIKAKDSNISRPSMARLGRALVLSVDHRPVQSAVAVATKTNPALSDNFVGTTAPVMQVQFAEIAGLLESESRRLATPQNAPIFSRVTREQLKPRLDALGKLGPIHWRLPTDSAKPAEPALDQWSWRTFSLGPEGKSSKP